MTNFNILLHLKILCNLKLYVFSTIFREMCYKWSIYRLKLQFLRILKTNIMCLMILLSLYCIANSYFYTFEILYNCAYVAHNFCQDPHILENILHGCFRPCIQGLPIRYLSNWDTKSNLWEKQWAGHALMSQ